MDERRFQREMAQSFKYIFGGALYIKIPDSFGMTKFTTVKYVDAIFFRNEKFYALEYKQLKGPLPFPKAKLNDVQRETLRKVQGNGGKSYVIINYRYKVGKERVDFALFLDFQEYSELESSLVRKSVPYKELLKIGKIVLYNNIKESGKSSKSLKVYRLQEIFAD